MSKPFFEITNKSADKKSVDMLIYGSIPAWDDEEWKMTNTVQSFLKALRALEKDYDRINVRINSPGGSLYHAFPIFNAIRNSKKDIHTYNDGLAASAGGLILIAGGTVHSAKNGILMIHNAGSWAMGNAEKLRDMAKTLDTYDSAIATLLAEKSGMSEDEIKDKYLNYKDHWMTATEAEENSFIDVVEDYESEDAPPANITDMAFGEILNLYQKKEEEPKANFLDKVVKHVKAALAPANPPKEPKTPTPPSNLNSTTDMKFENELAILNKENPTAEELAQVKASIEAITGENEVFTAEEVQDQVTAKTAEIQGKLDTAVQEKKDQDTKVTDLENKVAAYQATGVKLDNSKGEKPDPVPGDEPTEDFYSEADEEVKALRAKAGFVDQD